MTFRTVALALLATQLSSPTPITDDSWAKGAYRVGSQIKTPEALKKIPPQFPYAAQIRGLGGVVEVEAIIGIDGSVKKVRVSKSVDKRYGLDDAAKGAVKKWTFAPARLGETPVPVLVSLAVEFRNPFGLADPKFREGAVAENAPGVTTPVLKKKTDPSYTSEAMQHKIVGDVWLNVVIDVDGSVKVMSVKKSLDKEFGLDYAAIAAASQWRFEPAKLNGQPVRMLATIVMEFKLH